MQGNTSRKYKVNLTDYDHRRDIENRLLTAQLSVFEVDVLNEILYSSIRTPICDLAYSLDVGVNEILPVLNRLTTTKLLHHDGKIVTVNKEMRRYYESRIELFDDDFRPSLDFLQGLLSKVPIHVLPTWYAIPRSSDNIFRSIIEKYLATPKIYRKYLKELQFDDPILSHIVDDVFQSPGQVIRSRTLRERYHLSREQFEEYMLILEFNFVCCLHYKRIEDMWKEVVTPFHEWHEYLRFHENSKPSEISDTSLITNIRDNNFRFIKVMAATLRAASQTPLSLKITKNEFKPTSQEIEEMIHFEQEDFSKVVNTLCFLQLAKLDQETLCALPNAKKWLKQSLTDQAINLYRYSTKHPLRQDPLWTDRNIRFIEKGLKRIQNYKWITIEDFICGEEAPIGDNKEVYLTKNGRQWKYQLPTYSKQEKAFIHSIIFEHFYEVGMVATGIYEGKPCFHLTTFGRTTLSD